jgi:NAD-dependent deacetylase
MKITFFTGAGISEQSGIPTFRTGENSIWNKYDPDIVCNIKSWKKHKEDILNFFNEVMDLVSECEPNEAHKLIADLEQNHEVNVVTTNVDDLHERAGSTNVIHIHGNIFESCDINYNHVKKLHEHIEIGMVDPKSQKQLRHNVVMFGEMPHNYNQAEYLCGNCDILVIIGTSLSVYPACNLVFDSTCKEKYYMDPCDTPDELLGYAISHYQMSAEKGLRDLIETLEL